MANLDLKKRKPYDMPAQGVTLSLFLLLGGLVAWLSLYFGPPKTQLKTGGKLIEYRKLELTNQAITKLENVQNYSKMTVLTKVTEPENGTATVVAYGMQDNGVISEIRRIENVSSAWTSWEQEISYSKVEIIIEPPSHTNTTPQQINTPSMQGTVAQTISNSSQPSTVPTNENRNGTQGSITQPQQGITQAEENLTPGIKVDILIYLHPK